MQALLLVVPAPAPAPAPLHGGWWEHCSRPKFGSPACAALRRAPTGHGAPAHGGARISEKSRMKCFGRTLKWQWGQLLNGSLLQAGLPHSLANDAESR